MNDRERLLAMADRVLRLEAESIAALRGRLDDRFVEAVDLLRRCRGRVIVTGMGKSGLIGRKIAATLASTGTPAYFLHPAEGVHGDIGMMAREDVVLGSVELRGDGRGPGRAARHQAPRRLADSAHRRRRLRPWPGRPTWCSTWECPKRPAP